MASARELFDNVKNNKKNTAFRDFKKTLKKIGFEIENKRGAERNAVYGGEIAFQFHQPHRESDRMSPVDIDKLIDFISVEKINLEPERENTISSNEEEEQE